MNCLLWKTATLLNLVWAVGGELDINNYDYNYTDVTRSNYFNAVTISLNCECQTSSPSCITLLYTLMIVCYSVC